VYQAVFLRTQALSLHDGLDICQGALQVIGVVFDGLEVVSCPLSIGVRHRSGGIKPQSNPETFYNGTTDFVGMANPLRSAARYDMRKLFLPNSDKRLRSYLNVKGPVFTGSIADLRVNYVSALVNGLHSNIQDFKVALIPGAGFSCDQGG